MSSQTQLEQEDVVQEVFPGAEFAAAREAKGLDIQGVANALNFSAAHLIAIEEGRLEALPSRVFALGYLRAYARHLGLDENKAVADYERLSGGGKPSVEKPLKTVGSAVRPAKPKAGRGKWLVLVALVAGTAGAGYWWIQQQQHTSVGADPVATISLPAADAPLTPVETAQEVVLPALAEEPMAETAEQPPIGMSESEQAFSDGALESENTADAVVVETGADDVSEPADQGVQVAAVASDAEAAADSPVATASDEVSATGAVAAEQALVAGEGHLTIVFNAECWVEVRDDSGRLLVASVRSPERGVDVRGKAPLSVTLGALSAVDSMSYNNETVALAQRGRGNVLRMSLPVVE